MFNISDIVMYGNTGACKIVDIRREKFGLKEDTYYVLEPVEDKNAIIYYPVANETAKMRSLLSESQIYRLIQAMPDAKTVWIENDTLRREKFSQILRRRDHKELVQLIKTLYFARTEAIQAGRKFHLTDEKMMRDAENLLYGEFAQVLGIKPEEVTCFIMGELQKSEATSENES